MGAPSYIVTAAMWMSAEARCARSIDLARGAWRRWGGGGRMNMIDDREVGIWYRWKVEGCAAAGQVRALSQDELKQQAAWKAVEYVSSGMVLGLGTGSTAAYAVRRPGLCRLPADGVPLWHTASAWMGCPGPQGGSFAVAAATQIQAARTAEAADHQRVGWTALYCISRLCNRARQLGRLVAGWQMPRYNRRALLVHHAGQQCSMLEGCEQRKLWRSRWTG